MYESIRSKNRQSVFNSHYYSAVEIKEWRDCEVHRALEIGCYTNQSRIIVIHVQLSGVILQNIEHIH